MCSTFRLVFVFVFVVCCGGVLRLVFVFVFVICCGVCCFALFVFCVCMYVWVVWEDSRHTHTHTRTHTTHDAQRVLFVASIVGSRHYSVGRSRYCCAKVGSK